LPAHGRKGTRPTTLALLLPAESSIGTFAHLYLGHDVGQEKGCLLDVTAGVTLTNIIKYEHSEIRKLNKTLPIPCDRLLGYACP
jgi:hypothetical protein